MREIARPEPQVDQVSSEIIRALSREAPPGVTLTMDTDLFRDLALDSLSMTSLVVELEDTYRIMLNETDAQEIRTVSDLATLVVRRVGEQA